MDQSHAVWGNNISTEFNKVVDLFPYIPQQDYLQNIVISYKIAKSS